MPVSPQEKQQSLGRLTNTPRSLITLACSGLLRADVFTHLGHKKVLKFLFSFVLSLGSPVVICVVSITSSLSSYGEDGK